MKLLSIVALSMLVSCGGYNDGVVPVNSIKGIKNTRAELAKLSKISNPSFKSEKNLKALFTSNPWTEGGVEYENGESIPVADFFGKEFDSERLVDQGASNLFNRIDEAFLILCALVIDFGEDLKLTDGKVITANANSINQKCGTSLIQEQISWTGSEATIEAFDGEYEKKITIQEDEGDSVYYVTNNDEFLRFGTAMSDLEDNTRLLFELDKKTNNFKVDYINNAKSGGNDYPYIYRVISTDGVLSVAGKMSHGSRAEYFATLKDDMAAIDFEVDITPPTKSITGGVCVNTQTQDFSLDFADCFEEQPSENLALFQGNGTTNLFGSDVINAITFKNFFEAFTDSPSAIAFNTVGEMATEDLPAPPL